MPFEKGHPYYPQNPNSPKRQKLRRSMESLNQDLQSLGRGESLPGGKDFSWLTGGEPSESNRRLSEEIDRENQRILTEMEEQDVETLPDLWPKKGVEEGGNYYQGPTKSTRVSKHMFSLNPPANPNVPATHGTMFVRFTNMRPNGSVRRENVYAYYNVPFSVYTDFSRSNSKGQYINRIDKIYNYARLDDESVFDIGA